MRGAYSMLTDFPVAGMEKMSRLVAVPIIIYPCVCMWRYTPLECYIYIYTTIILMFIIRYYIQNIMSSLNKLEYV